MINSQNIITSDELLLVQKNYQEICIKSLFLDVMNFVQKHQFEDFNLILDAQYNKLDYEIKEKGQWVVADEFFVDLEKDQQTLNAIEDELSKLESKYHPHLSQIIEHICSRDCSLQPQWFGFNPQQYLECAQKFCGEKIAHEIEKDYLTNELKINHTKEVMLSKKRLKKIKV